MRASGMWRLERAEAVGIDGPQWGDGYAILSGIQPGSASTPSPMITSQPTNQTAAVMRATFSVTASGTALAYQWSFNTTNLVGRPMPR